MTLGCFRHSAKSAKFMYAKALLILSLLLVFSARGISANRVELLPAWSQASSWKASGENISIHEALPYLRFDFRATAEKEKARVLLQAPIEVPAWADGLTFLNVNSRIPLMAGIRLILADAAGKEFLVDLRALRSRNVGWDVSMLVRWGSVWPIPGIIPTSWTRAIPSHPYRFLGLEIECQRVPTTAGTLEMYLTDFAFTRLKPNDSQLYYQLQAFTRFGELDPVPWITLGELGNPEGNRATVSWEIRDKYDGSPFVAGGQEFSLRPDEALTPQMAERIAFPLLSEGTYWIRLKSRWFRGDQKVPSALRMSEMRLYVKRGAPAAKQSPLAASARTPHSFIAIAPGRERLVFDPAETIDIHFQRPPGFSGELKATVELVRRSTGETEKEVSRSFDGNEERIDLSLSDVSAGGYFLRAQLHAGDRIYDAWEFIIGVNGETEEAPHSSPSVKRASASDILSRRKPMFHLWPRIPDYEHIQKFTVGKTKMDYIQPFFDQAREVSSEVEYPLYWRDVEVLPGVYDWAEMDRVMDMAAERGMQVMISPIVCSKEPSWLPAIYKEDADGNVTIPALNKKYILNILYNWEHVPEMGRHMLGFIEEMAKRYRNHPALQGYSFFFEFAGNLPGSFRWNDGYDEFTTRDFQKWSREKYGSLEKLNAAWDSELSDWKAIVPPPNPPGDETSLAWRLDWWKFRADYFNRFLICLAESVRKYDPQGIILYDSQIFDDPRVAECLHELGSGMANGGAHSVEKVRSSLQHFSEGFHERSESVNVEEWSAMSPYQIDATLFMMTLGGGGGTHCKAFIDGTKPFADLRKPPYSLDRYEKFIPLWTELKNTRPMPFDAYFYRDMSGVMVGLNNFGAISVGQDAHTIITCMENHLTFGVGSSEQWEKAPLLMAISSDVEYLEDSSMKELMKYVEDGGNLIITARTGRYNITGKDRGSLLEKFGLPEVPPPVGPEYSFAQSLPVAPFGEARSTFLLQRPSVVASLPADANTIAIYENGSPAVSWKALGKGRLIVIWAENVPAPSRDEKSFAHPHEPPSGNLLRDLARWCGVRTFVSSPVPNLYMNLLKDKANDTFYGLAQFASYRVQDPKAFTTKAGYSLPEGTYEVTELISGRKLGRFTSKELADGIKDTWEPGAVTLYRMKKTQAP